MLLAAFTLQFRSGCYFEVLLKSALLLHSLPIFLAGVLCKLLLSQYGIDHAVYLLFLLLLPIPEE